MLVLVVEGCEVVEGGVATLTVVEDLDEVEHRRAWPARVAQTWRSSSSHSKVAKKLSATALSSASPMVPMEATGGLLEAAAEGQAGVLAAVVAVMHQARARIALGDGHVEERLGPARCAGAQP